MRPFDLTNFLNVIKSADLFQPIRLSSDQIQKIQSRQYTSLLDAANASILACMLNVTVLVMSFWQTSFGRLVLIWGGVMLVTMLYFGFIVRMKGQSFPNEDTDHEDVKKGLDGIVRAATLTGMMWATITLIVIPFLSDEVIGLTSIGMILIGTMFGGVLFMGILPTAAMGLVLPVVTGILISLQTHQDQNTSLLSVMSISYGGLLLFLSRVAYVHFIQQQRNQIDLESSKELIGILLRDFEANTSDWLWQTDKDDKFLPKVDIESNEVTSDERMPAGLSILEAFEADEFGQQLSGHVAERRPFKDQLVSKINCEGETTWLRLSAKPVFNQGDFQGYRGVASDITQLKKSEDQAAFMAQYDALTGLPNREKLKAGLTALSNDFKRPNRTIALIWLDLDNFKWVNDTMGHMAGDELLCQTAKRLTELLAPFQGNASRFTSDEFVCYFEFSADEDPFRIINEFETVMAQPYSLAGTKITCRATMGVNFIPYGVFDVEHCLKQADLALHNAKSRNKGSWVQFTQAIEDQAQTLRKLESDLEQALERNELRLMFQPIMDSRSGKAVACETLLRWQHPTRGLLSPGAFINFAEDTGVISRMGDWVLREALVQARRMPDDMRVAINLSPLQLHSQNLLPTIVNSIAQNGISPDRVELEITESVMISDPEFTLAKLKRLKEIGVRIALDDFGTGFSSLSYLQKFQFDKLKIDRSFVEDIDTNIDNQAIVTATLQLARALGMRTTGEGIETPRQAEYLSENGCDELQGYMFSRPLPLDKLGHIFDVKPEGEMSAEPAIQLKAPSKTKPGRKNKVA